MTQARIHTGSRCGANATYQKGRCQNMLIARGIAMDTPRAQNIAGPTEGTEVLVSRMQTASQIDTERAQTGKKGCRKMQNSVPNRRPNHPVAKHTLFKEAFVESTIFGSRALHRRSKKCAISDATNTMSTQATELYSKTTKGAHWGAQRGAHIPSKTDTSALGPGSQL